MLPLPVPPSRPRRPIGASLIELMVATALTMMVMAVITTLYSRTTQQQTESQKSAGLNENGRFALETLAEEIQMAGYLGDFAPTGDAPSTPDACATLVASLGFNSNPLTIPIPLFGYDGDDANSLPCLSDRKVSGDGPVPDVLVVRRTETIALAPGAATTGNAYLQSSSCSNDPSTMPIVFSNTPSAFTLHKKDCTVNNDIRRFLVRIFYIGNCSDCPGDSVPSLRMAELGSGQISVTTLVEGIENLQVEYGIDVNNDGQVDQYQECNTSTPCNAATWRNVVTARLHVLARTVEATATSTGDTKVYSMGAAGDIGPLNDKFKRHVYTALVRLENVAGRRETP